MHHISWHLRFHRRRQLSGAISCCFQTTRIKGRGAEVALALSELARQEEAQGRKFGGAFCPECIPFQLDYVLAELSSWRPVFPSSSFLKSVREGGRLASDCFPSTTWSSFPPPPPPLFCCCQRNGLVSLHPFVQSLFVILIPVERKGLQAGRL